ncbi:MAG: hypothetical protein M3N26_11505 [Pseudomonadota bacterium]|nr:hypothetical protein [Pseudomonadota bacterium]
MNERWQHQVRLYVDEAGRALLDDPAHPLHTVLRRHDAVLVSQLDAFEAFLADPEQAETPLGRWTAATLADPEKRAKHRLSIALRIGGAEVYHRDAADALEAELRPFVEDGTLQRLSRHDTDPAGNLPIPAEFRS